MNYRTLINLLSIDWINTLKFNLFYFKIKDAIRIPILVSYRTKIVHLGGRILLENVNPSFGLIKIGFQSIGFQDGFYDRTIWDVLGIMTLSGSVNIGRGSKICVLEGG